MKSFKKKVIDVVERIPQGNTLSYKEVATLAGNSKAARAVGNILKRNYDKNIPCHRVIKVDGKFGDYNKGEKIKREILKKEGVHE
ncbi:MAG: MGMT family protein [Patescibacteria group bacterium]